MLFIEFSMYVGQMSHPQHKTKCDWKDVTLLQHCHMLTQNLTSSPKPFFCYFHNTWISWEPSKQYSSSPPPPLIHGGYVPRIPVDA